MLAQVEALVTHIDDERILRESGVIQIIQQGGDGLIQREDAAQVVLHVPAPALFGHIALRLVFAGAEIGHELIGAGIEVVAVYVLQTGFNPVHAPSQIGSGGKLRLVLLDVEVCRNLPGKLAILDSVAQLSLGDDFLHHVEGNSVCHQVHIIPVAEVPAYALAIMAQEFRAVAPVIVQGGRRGHLGHMLLDDIQVAHSGNPVAVWCLVAHDKGEWLAAVAAFHPRDGHVRDHIGHIAAHAVAAR